jgi:hypothetical protein
MMTHRLSRWLRESGNPILGRILAVAGLLAGLPVAVTAAVLGLPTVIAAVIAVVAAVGAIYGLYAYRWHLVTAGRPARQAELLARLEPIIAGIESDAIERYCAGDCDELDLMYLAARAMARESVRAELIAEMAANSQPDGDDR